MTTNVTKDQGNGETTLARPKTPAQTVQGWLASPTMSASLAAALGGYMDFKQFAAQCYITAQDPDLARCSAESLMKCFLEVAQMGLLPGAAHKHVALIPRNGIITVQPEYRGFCFLMEKQVGVKRVKPELVHITDEFSVEGTGVHHKYDPFNPDRVFTHPDVAKKEKKECGLRGGYLEVQYDDGRVEYHFTPFPRGAPPQFAAPSRTQQVAALLGASTDDVPDMARLVTATTEVVDAVAEPAT